MPKDYSQFKEVAAAVPVDGVLHVEFNKPKKLNAVNAATWREYGNVLRLAATDNDVRAVVVSGQGRAFCAGLDISDPEPQHSEDFSRRALSRYNFIREFQNAIKTAYDLNKPVIGVAHGVSYGLAIDLLCNVDIRFAAKGTRFSIREVVIGMAADIGTLQLMPRVVGNSSWVRELAFTGREFSAEEALQQGFVSRVYETQDEAVKAALDLAKQLAAYSPLATHGIKQSLNYAADHSLEDGLKQIAEYNSYAIETDLKVGIGAVLAKKRAVYSKL